MHFISKLMDIMQERVPNMSKMAYEMDKFMPIATYYDDFYQLEINVLEQARSSPHGMVCQKARHMIALHKLGTSDVSFDAEVSLYWLPRLRDEAMAGTIDANKWHTILTHGECARMIRDTLTRQHEQVQYDGLLTAIRTLADQQAATAVGSA